MFQLLLASCLLFSPTITVETVDKVKLSATFLEPKKVSKRTPAAILVPMYGNSRKTWSDFAESAKMAGITTLALDVRGHGESPNPAKKALAQWNLNNWLDVLKDIDAAKKHLIKAGYSENRIVIVGASIGASLCLEYAVKNKKIAGLGMLSVSTNLTGKSPEANLARYGTRKLFMAFSDNDRQFINTSLRMARTVQKTATLRRYQRAGHGTQMFGRENTKGDLTKSLIQWIKKVT